MAGGGSAEGQTTYREILTDLVPTARIIVDSDIQAASAGALGGGAGIVLIAGTGSIAMGRMPDGTTFRYGGWGARFGDEGSGYWIGREAIRTALAFAEDGRRSDFPRFVARSLGVPTISNVIPACADGTIGVARIAPLAERLIERCPEEPGTGILKAGAEHLRHLVDRAMLRFGSANVPVVALGGVASQPVVRNLIGLEFTEPKESTLRGAIRTARLEVRAENGES
jgi:N-acetylglucosamine kinase-like BadF-type ATPase